MRKILGSQIREGSNGEQYITRSFKYVLGQRVTCHECGENSKACVWRGKVKERGQLEELGIGGSIILKWADLTEIGVETVDWFSLAQDRSNSGPAVNAVLNLPVPQSAGNFLTS